MLEYLRYPINNKSAYGYVIVEAVNMNFAIHMYT